MKVICIDASIIVLPPYLTEGKIYETRECTFCHNGCCYELKNDKGVYCGFKKSRFIPLSEIDETEVERKDFYAGSKSGLSFLK